MILFHIDEYVIEKPHRKKGKKRSKKRPQSATTTTHTDSVRMKISMSQIFSLLLVFLIPAKSYVN
jgi:hypothetical protein